MMINQKKLKNELIHYIDTGNYTTNLNDYIKEMVFKIASCNENKYDVDDYVQESCIAVFKYAHNFRRNGNAFNYLYQIIKQSIYNCKIKNNITIGGLSKKNYNESKKTIVNISDITTGSI